MYRLAFVLIVALLLNACRVEVVAPPEVAVSYRSAAFNAVASPQAVCDPGALCTMNIGTGVYADYLGFSIEYQNYVDPNYVLTGWRQGVGYLPCREPQFDVLGRRGCALSGLEAYYDLAPDIFDLFLESDLVFRVEPVVEFMPYDGLGADLSSAIPLQLDAQNEFMEAPYLGEQLSRWYVLDFPVGGVWRIYEEEERIEAYCDPQGWGWSETVEACRVTPRIWSAEGELFFPGSHLRRDVLVEPGIYFVEVLHLDRAWERRKRLIVSEFEPSQ